VEPVVTFTPVSDDGNAGAEERIPVRREPSPDVVPSSERVEQALGIPDYDSLSASQVVPRLAGLSQDELEAVRAYETANRGRRTVLSKIAQLQAR
jgi:hypothetical protein